jgi:hypothetical protein
LQTVIDLAVESVCPLFALGCTPAATDTFSGIIYASFRRKSRYGAELQGSRTQMQIGGIDVAVCNTALFATPQMQQ